MCQNADYQLKAHLLGKVVTLTPGETRLASALNALPNVTNRTWEYWTGRLDQGRRHAAARGAGESASAGRIGKAAGFTYKGRGAGRGAKASDNNNAQASPGGHR